jgi:hypothetical protein
MRGAAGRDEIPCPPSPSSAPSCSQMEGGGRQGTRTPVRQAPHLRLALAPPRWPTSRGSVPREAGSGLPLGLPGAYGPRSTLWRLRPRSEGGTNRALHPAPRCVSRPPTSAQRPVGGDEIPCPLNPSSAPGCSQRLLGGLAMAYHWAYQVPTARGLPSEGPPPRSEGGINRDLDAAPRTRLPPADPCAEVGGYMRGVVGRRRDPLSS